MTEVASANMKDINQTVQWMVQKNKYKILI